MLQLSPRSNRSPSIDRTSLDNLLPHLVIQAYINRAHGQCHFLHNYSVNIRRISIIVDLSHDPITNQGINQHQTKDKIMPDFPII